MLTKLETQISMMVLFNFYSVVDYERFNSIEVDIK